MSRIALFGAAGAIGNSIAAALRAAGQSYRVVGRDAASLERDFGADPLAEIVTWNPDVPASVQAAATGIDTLVYLVGVKYWQFALHPELMRKTLAGAIAAGVKNVILIGTVYPYGRVQNKPVREDHPRQPHTFKGRMRKEQEDILMRAHREGRINATVLRLPDFYGPGVTASLLHGAAVAALSGATANLLGPVDLPHEFVFVPDVGPVVLKLAAAPGAWGRFWHLAGAGVTTQREMVAQMAHHTGAPVSLRVAGKATVRFLGLFSRMMREMVEMHYLLSDPLIMDDSALQTLIGPLTKTSYVEGVRLTLEALQALPSVTAAPVAAPGHPGHAADTGSVSGARAG